MILVERESVAETKDKVVMVVVLLTVFVITGVDMVMAVGPVPILSVTVTMDVLRVEEVVAVPLIASVFQNDAQAHVAIRKKSSQHTPSIMDYCFSPENTILTSSVS